MTKDLLRRLAFVDRFGNIVLLQAVDKSNVRNNFVVQRNLCLAPLVLVGLSQLGAETLTLTVSLLSASRQSLLVILEDQITESIPAAAGDGLDNPARP